MKEKMTGYFNWVMGKSNSSNEETAGSLEANNNANNKSIRFQQFKTLFAVLMVVSLIAGSVALFIKSKSEPKDARKDQDKAVLTVELADKNLDPEKHWRNYFEEKQEQSVKDIDKRLNDLSKTQEENLEKANSRIERELVETQEKLNMARQELARASLDIRRVAKENNQKTQTPIYQGIELEEQSYDSDIELDVPKSAKNYIPEGTYFTGHLLGGIAVSTGLNTPDDNATPVAIKLIGRFVQGENSSIN